MSIKLLKSRRPLVHSKIDVLPELQREIDFVKHTLEENAKLLDVFGQKSNVSLVFDFMDTDLEIIIKDSSIILTHSHIKSYILQTLKGLEYLYSNWILHRIPFLPGDSDLDQLSKIFQCLGTPKDGDWPAMEHLPDFVQFKPCPGTPLKEIFIAASDDLLELLTMLLTMDPLSRITAPEALQMSYFYNKPYPTPGHLLPQLGNSKKNIMDQCRPQSQKRKLDTEPGIKRKRWSSDEDRDFCVAFRHQIEQKKNVSTADIRAAQKKFGSLKKAFRGCYQI